MLPAAIALQSLESVPGRHAEVRQRRGGIQHGKLVLCPLRDPVGKALRHPPLEDRRRALVGEALDHVPVRYVERIVVIRQA
jgi:hypothetical protein